MLWSRITAAYMIVYKAGESAVVVDRMGGREVDYDGPTGVGAQDAIHMLKLKHTLTAVNAELKIQ